jgi:dTMP kinase
MIGADSLLICLEGLDQSGKKTQVELLIKRLRKEGWRTENISFPDYNTLIGREIKAFLCEERTYNVNVRHILYSANRWERMKDVARWIREKKIVIVDRYSPSNLAYGLASGLELAWLLCLERGLPKADLVIIIDVSADMSFKRKRSDRDVYERDLLLLKKVRQNYIRLSGRFNWVLIDGERKLEDVHSDVWKSVGKYLMKNLQ